MYTYLLLRKSLRRKGLFGRQTRKNEVSRIICQLVFHEKMFKLPSTADAADSIFNEISVFAKLRKFIMDSAPT